MKLPNHPCLLESLEETIEQQAESKEEKEDLSGQDREARDSPLSFCVEGVGPVQCSSWRPSGVSLLVGVPGCGKSILMNTIDVAARHLRRIRQLRDFVMNPGSRVAISNEEVTWEESHGEASISLRGQRLRTAKSEESHWAVRDMLQKGQVGKHNVLSDETASQWGRMKVEADEFYRRISGIRMIDSELARLTDLSYYLTRMNTLNPAGDNDPVDLPHPAILLQRWKTDERFSWVESAMADVFPSTFTRFDFPERSSGIIIDGAVMCGSSRFAITKLSAGMLRTLLLFTALAHAKRGDTLFFDGIDEGMHPTVITRALRWVFEREEKIGFTAVFATHSPRMISSYVHHAGDADGVWVMDSSGVRSLDGENGCLDREWLATYNAGSIYGSAYAKMT